MNRWLWHGKLKRLDLSVLGKESICMHGKTAGCVLMLACCVPVWVQAAPDTGEVKAKIAWKIWQNECAGTIRGLVSWNRGEAFPSLGIGHFIWFPAGVTERFEESFPAFIQFCRRKGIRVPEELAVLTHANRGRLPMSHIPLTRLEVDPLALTREVFREIAGKITGDAYTARPVTPELIVGRSCGDAE